MAKRKMMKKNKAKKVISSKTPSITDSINSEVIAAALSSVNQPVFLKVCRLCETKDGPFLNIFDPDMITAKKVEVVMPFVIAENDDLPHKICFRCSAKVEELYEFIQKCINTQKSLRKAVGAKGSIINKPRHRELWEEKLNQSNISNDDICDALIKKAMEGIKDIPLNPLPLYENEPPVIEKATKKAATIKEDTLKKVLDDIQEKEKTDIATKSGRVEPSIPQQESITKSLRSKVETKTNESDKKATKLEEQNPTVADKTVKKENSNAPVESNSKKVSNKLILQTNTFSLDDTKAKPKPEPAFNIMDHVSMIKVNGVGVLFQCKLCNRNFLKKEVVMSHACAKNGPSKTAGPKILAPPEPPKIPPSVKYINTKEVKKPVDTNKDCQFIDLDDEDEDDKPLVTKKPKPKIGPASKVKRNTDASETSKLPVCSNKTLVNVKTDPTIQEPVVQFPSLPCLNSRYKLVPGPNNTFTLVEEKIIDNAAPSTEKVENTPNVNSLLINKDKPNRQNIGTRRCVTAGKSEKNSLTEPPTKPPQLAATQPYPVGLFKTLSSNADVPIVSEPVGYTTPAMKKQSYTVVQTGNPSKLLISSKPQAPVEEVPKKRQRKARHEVKADVPNKQPFSVTLEDTAPPRDPGFFTFINVDPLLQPSYVLPTNNIIQESQISTSTSVSKQTEKEKDSKYTCNMCNETFTREKKLLAHIQSHYSKMDEEDQLRADKVPRKRRK